MKKIKPAILQSYDDPLKSAYEAKYITKTLTRFVAERRGEAGLTPAEQFYALTA